MLYDDFRSKMHLHVGGTCRLVSPDRRRGMYTGPLKDGFPYKILQLDDRRVVVMTGAGTARPLTDKGVTPAGGNKPETFTCERWLPEPAGNKFGIGEVVTVCDKRRKIAGFPAIIESFCHGKYRLSNGDYRKGEELRPYAGQPVTLDRFVKPLFPANTAIQQELFII